MCVRALSHQINNIHFIECRYTHIWRHISTLENDNIVIDINTRQRILFGNEYQFKLNYHTHTQPVFKMSHHRHHQRQHWRRRPRVRWLIIFNWKLKKRLFGCISVNWIGRAHICSQQNDGQKTTPHTIRTGPKTSNVMSKQTNHFVMIAY